MSDAAASDTVLTADATATADAGAATTTATTTAPAADTTSTLLTDDPKSSADDATKTDTTDGDKPKDGEDKDAKKDEPKGAPEEYADFKLPENFQADTTVLGEFKVIAKDLGLTQDAAQKLVDFQTAQATKTAQAYGTALQTQVDTVAKEWATTAKADPEIGGAKFDENVALAKQALDTFGTPELKALLKESRIGNHPEVIRMLFKAGKAISQDGFVPGRAGSAAKDTASTLYGSTPSK